MPKILDRKNWPLLTIAATILLAVLQLRAQERIWFCECGELRFWTSDADGRFTFAHLAAVSSWLAVEHEDYGLSMHSLELHDGAEQRDIVLRVGSGSAVSGRLLRSDGSPVAAWDRGVVARK